MALVYRSIWNDKQEDPILFANQQFLLWLRTKGIHEVIPENGVLESENLGRFFRISSRASTSELIDVIELELYEENVKSKAVVLTKLLAVSDRNFTGTYVIDVERENNNFAIKNDFQSPSLVLSMIKGSTEPNVDEFPIADSSISFSDHELLSYLSDKKRTLPVLLFSRDPWLSLEENMHREKIASDRLSGVSQVVFTSKSQTNLVRSSGLFGDSFFEGDVLLCLPLRTENSFQDNYHLLQKNEIENRFYVSDYFSRLLSGIVTARRIPKICVDGLKVLRKGSSKDPSELLLVAESIIQDNENVIADLREVNALLEQDLFDAQVELESEISEGNYRQGQFALLLSQKSGVDEVDLSIQCHTSELAISYARNLLSGISIPSGVEQGIGDIDSHVLSKAWGLTLWQGLRALHVYALSNFDGDFRQWCQESNHVYAWSASPKKLAMRESEATESNQKLKDQRLFPVISALDESRKKYMVAHLKISQSGSVLIPRVYFYDDTRGATGLVHIGFIGPHKHIDNTRTN